MASKYRFFLFIFISLLIFKIQKKKARNIALLKAKKYMKKCLEGILTNIFIFLNQYLIIYKTYTIDK